MANLFTRPATRWVAPVLAAALAIGVPVGLSAQASAEPTLPARTAQELLVDLQALTPQPLSGEVTQVANLGLPELPGVASPGVSGASLGSLLALASGTHTWRVWTDGAEKARLAVNDEYAETDVVTDGNDVWTYDSRAKTATHTALPAGDPAADRQAPAGAPQTPQQAASEVLAKLTPTTDVRVDPDVTVAGQAAYDLVLTPKDTGSLVKQVRLAVDGANFVPLRVQVFGSADKPALDVAYTDIAFGQPL